VDHCLPVAIGRPEKWMVLTMETTKAKVNEDIEALKHDVRRLRDDVVGKAHAVRSRGRETVMETGDRIRDMMADFRGKAKEAKEQFRDRSAAMKDRGYEAVENWRGRVEDRPITSLLIAFGAGLIFALFIARRRD
jgi:ElaB/YqjD/DUF883 family membrane-anchored ribosome-binding protein